MTSFNEMNDQERLDFFAKMNSKELELLMHHASIELQERSMVAGYRAETPDEALGRQTAEERRQWL